MKCSKFQLLAAAAAGLLLLFSACSKDSLDPATPSLEQAVIWDGPTITFTKANGADPNLPDNQDQLTSLVALTRANAGGGQIYNAISETSADKNSSPAGTLWALGTTAELPNLTFRNFRAAVDKPQQAVGTDLVLLLVEENIAIDLKFTSWAQGKQGGFSYERSTE